MLSSALKQSLGLALVMAALAGCTSTSTVDGTGNAGTTGADTDTSTESTVSTGSAGDSGLTTRGGQMEESAPAIDTVFYFEFDKSLLNAQSRAALTAHAAQLKSSPRSIRLEGHADERGTREYNMALGERRAKSVRDFLVLQGVDSSMIETISYGEEYPAMRGSSESSYAKNRRVELK
ncbi:peptidoglycan-associated lipoprotein Pal [Pseudomaricurvus alkylphenolicus]|uniref:peptidoglycan-associated lipoprotein Pal n=1 Tax=Pseudomaricurvus alkylphenolicus TaxID=1306991 RepID=UPI00141DC931|nr:peptidoglycan-associated lipoprotein Pal [Pseudomaricurvus alkylphenolicus]NIB42005.1 peptidoglycan-associated lipoprotein Pal [Pseudomaricurvus alkylphenolicus]